LNLDVFLFLLSTFAICKHGGVFMPDIVSKLFNKAISFIYGESMEDDIQTEALQEQADKIVVPAIDKLYAEIESLSPNQQVIEDCYLLIQNNIDLSSMGGDRKATVKQKYNRYKAKLHSQKEVMV
jgi:hypothetical protein